MTDGPPNGVDLSNLTVQATKPRGQIARELAGLGIQVLPAMEDEGDVERFIVSKRLAVDRRTGHRFLNGIMDKTLFTSAIYLREHYQIPVVILEGGIDYTYRGFNPQAVLGALSAMMIEYGVSLLATADVLETVQLLVMFIRQEQTGIPEISLVPKRSAASLPDMQRRVIEMLPGCGRVMARTLLQEFGSIEGIVHASADELRKVKGIGLKKAKLIRQVLASDYEAIDAERQIEDAIERDHSILFETTVSMLARQHYIFGDDDGRHFVDMVFHDPDRMRVVLVELKKDRLAASHVAQLRRYLDHAADSTMIRRYADDGCAVRGLLASPDPGRLKTSDDDIEIRSMDANHVIRVLRGLRQERMGTV